MIKDIAVHLTGSAEDAVRLHYADDLARKFGAHLTGLYAHTLPELISYTDPSGSAFLRELIEQSNKEGDTVAARLTEQMSALGSYTELRRLDVFPGEVGKALAGEARVADLFVATRPYGGPASPAHIEEAVLFGAGRPCLFLPPQALREARMSTVLVGWKATREAARAVADAMPILQQADTVVVVMVSEGNGSLGSEPGADIGRFLSRHGIKAEIRSTTGAPDVGTALLREAQAQAADLIVMGGYGHSRLKELVLGGATRDVLVGAPIPVLMSH
jgi:nucleotide-binding universal stress UspA family protein